MGSPKTRSKSEGPREKLEVTAELAKEVAESIVDGETINNVVKAVNLSYPSVKKVMRSPEFTAEIKSIIRNRVANLANKMVDVLEKQLAEGNLEAVRMGFKVLGIIDPEPANQSKDQNITVIMPGAAPQEKVITTEVIDYADQSERDQSN